MAPLIPPAKRGGHKRTVDVREGVNGLMSILSTGCQSRAIPKDLPPRKRSDAQAPVPTGKPASLTTSRKRWQDFAHDIATIPGCTRKPRK